MIMSCAQEALTNEVKEIVAKHGKNRNALLPTLREIQSLHNGISDHVMQVVADELGIHPAEVFSVATFYSFLKVGKQGRFVIRLCRTISCDMAGKEAIARQLRNELGIDFGQSTPDGKYTLEWANCLGMCDQGPALLVNDKVYTKVGPEKIAEILEECEKTFGSTSAAKGKKETH